MTLSRQLFVVISILILIMLGRMFWISLDNTRSYLNGQMQTQTNNAVDSLGIALRPHLAKKDIAMMDTLINAVFDHGYYHSLLLADMQGQILIKRVNSDPIHDAPEWFIHLLPLDAPKVTAVVTSGWMQYGKLTLQAHPGRAYANLWASFRQLLVLALWTFFIGIVAVLLLVRGMLKPLRAIEAQAIAICKREFPINEERPWTREFRHVTEAMNRMTGKIRDIINTLTERAEELQHQARVDKLTGLANRDGFMPALNALLERHERSSSGLFLLVKLTDFAAFNDLVGYQIGDQLLQNIAAVLKAGCENNPDALAGRIGGVDFALMLPEQEKESAETLCNSIGQQLSALRENEEICQMLIGATLFASGDTAADILGRADTSLSIARTDGSGGIHIQNTENRSEGNIDWQQIIDDVLQQQRISLLSQAITTPDGESVYREVLARMYDRKGENISPATFMPMAERLGRIADVDRLVMQKTIDRLSTHSDAFFAVNISSHSLHDTAFRDWMGELFTRHEGGKHNANASHMLIEFTEHAALHNIEATAAFIKQAHNLGMRVVMEHFGSGLASFHSLRGLKLDYIKLDGSYVRGISADAQNRFFVHTLLDISHGLDIRVIAEHVEDATDLQSLTDMHIDAVQGYHIGKPEPLSD
ncbi:MAG: EAL domain-containing protein [Mariprofundaceae bacterium]